MSYLCIIPSRLFHCWIWALPPPSLHGSSLLPVIPSIIIWKFRNCNLPICFFVSQHWFTGLWHHVRMISPGVYRQQTVFNHIYQWDIGTVGCCSAKQSQKDLLYSSWYWSILTSWCALRASKSYFIEFKQRQCLPEVHQSGSEEQRTAQELLPWRRSDYHRTEEHQEQLNWAWIHLCSAQ